MPKSTGSDITRRITNWYRERPGLIIFYREAADDLGISYANANAAISRIASKYPEMGFKRAGPAGHYVYESNAEIEPAHGGVIPDTRPIPGLREALAVDGINPPDETVGYPAAPFDNDAAPVFPEPITSDPTPMPGEIGTVYEAIYRMKSGRMVVRDTNGDLFTLSEL